MEKVSSCVIDLMNIFTAFLYFLFVVSEGEKEGKKEKERRNQLGNCFFIT